VVLDLCQIVIAINNRLVGAGSTIASEIPDVGATLVVAHINGIQKIQRAVQALNLAANWLPGVGLALAVAAVALALRRRATIIALALGVGAGMILTGLGLVVLERSFLSAVPGDGGQGQVATILFDTLVGNLRWAIRAIFVVALLVAFGAWLSGSAFAAALVRRGRMEARQELQTGAVVPFVSRHALMLSIAIVSVFSLILLMTTDPSLALTVTLGAVAAVLLLAVQALRSFERRRASLPGTS